MVAQFDQIITKIYTKGCWTVTIVSMNVDDIASLVILNEAIEMLLIWFWAVFGEDILSWCRNKMPFVKISFMFFQIGCKLNDSSFTKHQLWRLVQHRCKSCAHCSSHSSLDFWDPKKANELEKQKKILINNLFLWTFISFCCYLGFETPNIFLLRV